MEIKKTKVFLDSIYEKEIEWKKFIVFKFVSDRLGTIKRYIIANKVDLDNLPDLNKPYNLVEVIKPVE